MKQVKENHEKEKKAREAFEQELEKVKKDNASMGSGKHRKLGGSGSHLMDYEMSDQHIFQSPEFMGEYERMSYGGGGSKRYGRGMHP
jgi:COP9 signalosome complex subunit 7